MALFTFTTISGSAATNNVVISVANGVAGSATLTILPSGNVAFVDALSGVADTGYNVADFAVGGIPTTYTGTAGAANITMSLATYLTVGVSSKLAGAADIDATGASSAEIDAFLANHAAANAGSLTDADLTAHQFSVLAKQGLLATGGALTVDATTATASELNYLVAAATTASAILADEAIDNIELSYAQVAALSSYAKFADASITVDAAGAVSTANVTTLMAAVTGANTAKYEAVFNVTADYTNVGDANFAAFAALVVDNGIVSIDATGFNSGAWTKIINAVDAVANDAIYDADTLTISQFVSITGDKFADNGISQINLGGPTTPSSSIDLVVADAAKLDANSVYNAYLTPGQFAALTEYIANDQATVNAATATAGEDTAILQNLGAFDNSLSNLSISADQFVSTTNASTGSYAELMAATVTTGVVSVDGAANTSGITIAATSANGVDQSLNIVGSAYNDTVSVAGVTTYGSTVQGGRGQDSITGSEAADEIRGGRAADTINGAGGNDIIYGGEAGNDGGGGFNSLTGGAGADTFILQNLNNTGVSYNLITDLGTGGVDVIQNDANVTTNATGVSSWTAGATTTNNGTITITSGGAGSVVNVDLSGGTAGWTLAGGAGADTLTGSDNNDSINGGVGIDVIAGGLGNNTLVGGTLADTFTVTGTDSITDLGTGADELIVEDGGIANAAVVANLIVTATTKNAGLATLTVANDVDVSLASATVAGAYLNGYTITAAGNVAGSTITGSAGADIITGAAGASSLVGGAGNDLITGGAAADSLVGGTGTNVLTGGLGADTFTTSGTLDTITDLGAGNASDILANTSAGLAATTTGNWTAGAGSTNAAAATITVGNGFNVNLATITAGTGLTIDADANALGGVFTGSSNDDTILGGAAANTISGGAGADSIVGGAAGDSILGGNGADNMTGAAGADTFDLTTTVAATDTITDWGNGADVLTGTTVATQGLNVTMYAGGTGVFDASTVFATNGVVNVTGTSAADVITGGANNDTVSGSGGNDTITGGTGADSITGGSNNDLFDGYTTATSTASVAASTTVTGDTITDFATGSDDFGVLSAGTVVFTDTTVANVNTTISTSADDFSDIATALGTITESTEEVAQVYNVAITAGALYTAGVTHLVIVNNGDTSFTAADVMINLTGTSSATVAASDFIFG